MNSDKILSLKKYLFFISIIVFLSLLISLVNYYIYADAKVEVLKGGKVSEAIIGNVPSLNPFVPLSGDNKYVMSFVYRSLLKYETKENKIKGDLASCDLTNLLYVECYIQDNLKWSNGENITINDVYSTYQIYKNTDVNPIVSSLLSDTKISVKDNIISFTNKAKNINFIDIFFLPIVSEKVINTVGSSDIKTSFKLDGGIYSGKYKIESLENGNLESIKKLTLKKNENYYKNDVFIDKIELDFFSDSSVFLKYKDSINLFNDTDNLIGDSIPRFKSNNFYLPQYVSLFVNKNNVYDENLRNFLLDRIDRTNLIKILGEKNFKEVINPYLTKLSIDQDQKDKNITKILSKIGYFRKSELLSNFISENTKNTENKNNSTGSVGTGSISTGTVSNSNNSNVSTSSSYVNEKSKIIVEPNFTDKYNFITKDDILLKGNVYKGVSSVYINDYKLSGFKEGNSFFYYRLRENIKNISQGANKYNIYFETNGKKEFIEEINFLYYKDNKVLEQEKNNFMAQLNKTSTSSGSIEIQNKISQDNLNVEKENLLKKQKFEAENKQKIDKINALDDKSFYNKDLKQLTFNLAYVSLEKNIEITANYIKDSLEQEGIKVNLTSVSLNELPNFLSKGKKYDFMLVAINLGNYDFDIFKYFHSSKVKNGYNFSNIKRLSLDILLEELAGNYFPPDRIADLEKKVLDILKEEQVVKVLYTPIITNLVDKNIKNYSIPEYILDKTSRNQSIENSYVIENKVINLKDKGFSGFIKFLFKTLNE